MKYILIVILLLVVAGSLCAGLVDPSFEQPELGAWQGNWGGMSWQTMNPQAPPLSLAFIFPPLGPAPDGALIAICKASGSLDFTRTYNATVLEAGTYTIALRVRRISKSDFGTNITICVGKISDEVLVPIAVTDQWEIRTLTIVAPASWQFCMAVGGNGDPWVGVDKIEVNKIGISNVAILPGGFLVTPGVPEPPVITGILPATAPNTVNVGVTIAGSGFRSGATVKLALVGQPDVLASNVIVVNSTAVTCTLNLVGVEAGAWDVVLTNP